MSYIRTSSVFVLPYKPDPEFDVYAASGMARVALQTSTPLITSNANLFNGMEKVAAACSSKEQWVKEISDIFEGKFDKAKMINDREKFLEENSWSNCSKKLLNIFKSAK
jgi:hypothetical protein